ncbi:MAG TPA: hypothetical protein VIJ38_17030 [Acidobacteriaceae bacterium]
MRQGNRFSVVTGPSGVVYVSMVYTLSGRHHVVVAMFTWLLATGDYGYDETLQRLIFALAAPAIVSPASATY